MKTHWLARGRRLVAVLGMILGLAFISGAPVQAQAQQCRVQVADFATYTACIGVFPDPTWAPGRPYGLQVPSDWNGTLILFSQGYAYPGSPPPSRTVESAGVTLNDYFEDYWWVVALDPFGKWLLHNGYAVASSWAGTGWTVQRSLHNQIATLDRFASTFGSPARTIAWGGSLGGMITAGLIQQHPERFAGAVSTAGILAGSVGAWNAGLDFSFAIQQLLGSGSGLQIVHITNPGTPTSGNMGVAMRVLDAAQGTPAGRARIALAGAFYDIPGWFDPLSAEPAGDEYSAREFNQYLWARYVLAPLMFGAGRTDIEERAGGNPSWNTGVNYEAQLEKSVNHAEVLALYQAAGLSLEEDLARLKAAPRIAADPGAIESFSEQIVFNGDLGGVPLLSVHFIGDGLITNQNASAYRSAVLEAHDSQLVRQVFINRAGHGPNSPAELIAAFQTLIQRIDTGVWHGSASPEKLNAAALALGPSYNVLDLGGGYMAPVPPGYIEFDPAPFLRTYDLAVADVPAAGGF